jgi:glycosyltransferase involved in cell wall biosynthesis
VQKVPKVSVIIPTYNRLKQCKTAVESVLEQSYKDFELIVIDDGSTDLTSQDTIFPSTSQISTKLIKLDKNSGVSSARNRGILEAKGEWLAFLDSDDIWDRDKLRLQVNWLTENSEYRILQTNEKWIRFGEEVTLPKQFIKKSGYIFEESLKKCTISPSSVIIHKTLFKEKGVFDETMDACEDYDLWLRITATEKIGLLDQKLMTRFGGEEDQLSTTVKLQDQYRIKGLLKILDEKYLIPEQINQVTKVLLKKCKIMINGATKRGNSSRVEEYQKLLQNITKKYL